MKSFAACALIASIFVGSVAHAGEFLVERISSIGAMQIAPKNSELKVVRSFEAFGKTWDVVEAASETSFSTPSVSARVKSFWKSIETNQIYKLQMGPKPPSKPDDLADFDPKPVIANDPLFNSLWGLLNYGQSIVFKGKRHMDAAVAQAWTLHKGSKDVVVGVVDTGVDYRHPDLRGNLWTTTIDGKVSYGWDALAQDNDPMDGHRHGTHVAGTIGAVGNNSIGVTGVNWETRIASVQIFDGSGATKSDAILRALDWLYRHRDEIRVVNHSWGGKGYSRTLHTAFEKLDDAGVINVFAAGNDSSELRELDVGSDKGFYPAMFELNNSIVVAAFDNNGTKSDFSNYGPDIVDLAAPGEDIQSTVLNSSYQSLSGTSMAAPHVTGAVALLMSYRPELRARQIKDAILSSATETSSLTNTSYKGRRLNAYQALKY